MYKRQGCGGCCRGREDIVLSGFDLWRIAARLRLPPRTVARAFCRGTVSYTHLQNVVRQFGPYLSWAQDI